MLMRALALDIGDVRCGIAATDVSGSIASPVCVLPLHAVVEGAPAWRRILEDYEPEILVCGLPTTLAGKEGSQAAHIRELAMKVSQNSQLPIEFVDERLSSLEAKRILRERGLSERAMRGKVDMVAASLFLQTWIARYNATSQREVT